MILIIKRVFFLIKIIILIKHAALQHICLFFSKSFAIELIKNKQLCDDVQSKTIQIKSPSA